MIIDRHKTLQFNIQKITKLKKLKFRNIMSKTT